MKFICLGYFDEEVLDSMSLVKASAFVAESLAYHHKLGDHITNTEVMQSPSDGKSVRNIDGKIEITEGSSLVMEKVLVTIITLEAEDIDHATELMSKHPGIKRSATFEIRRVDDLTELAKGIGK